MKLIRHITLFFTTLAITTSATAQQPFMDTSRPERLINIGVHVGDGLSTVRQNYATQIGSVASFTLTPGNVFDVGASATLNIRDFLGIGTGLDFTINNYDYNLTLIEVGEQNGTLNTLYSNNHFYSLDIPLYLKFAFNLGSRVRWTWELGSYINFGLGGHTNVSTYSSSTNPLGQSQVTNSKFHNKYFNDENGIINRIATTDTGLHLATGLIYNRHITLNAVLHVGFRDLARNFGVYKTELYNLNLIFKAGYLF